MKELTWFDDLALSHVAVRFRDADLLRYPLHMIDESLLARVTSLNPVDRLELIGAVWDTLTPDDLPVTDAERVLLDARLADMEAHPEDQSPWPKVKARLERASR